MTNWIPMFHDKEEDPRVLLIADLAKLSRFYVVGALYSLWVWADRNSVDGSDMMLTEAQIDRMVEKKGFAQAMRRAGWLSGEDYRLSFPGFIRKNGGTQKARLHDAKRKAAERSAGRETFAENRHRSSA